MAESPPVLAYGWPGGELAFAPKDEAERYASLRRAEGFPMTWGEFRTRFGDDLYAKFAPEPSDCLYESFAAFLEDFDESDYDVSAEEAWADLEVGGDGRPPRDDDEAFFDDGDGNLYETPVAVSWWPAQLMFRWFPRDIAQKYGRVVQSVLDGEFLQFDIGVDDEVVAELQARGFTCVEDSELMNAAAGY